MDMAEYVPLARAGAEGLVVYQETYHRETYAELHTFGPKKDFDWRLACPVRAYDAGFRRIGIGALFGLWRWEEEARALAATAGRQAHRVRRPASIRSPRQPPQRRTTTPSKPKSPTTIYRSKKQGSEIRDDGSVSGKLKSS